MLKIRNVQRDDLLKLVEIEQLCFTPEEAATHQAFEQRIKVIPDSFLVAEEDGILAGLINGPVIPSPFITDDLFGEISANPTMGGHQSILGLAVHPHFRNRRIASILLERLEQEAKDKQRETITLTCKESLIPFYEKHGYQNYGVSKSVHGGVVWYDMCKNI
ncbi:N-acetyltransferase [Bacillus sp. T3]|uniref:GNAT family N-acetyltransferase n=1 Tax=Bacillus sp. T3 TaxID=467262 RepID=UPI002980A7F6|nr:N-acetyltransferase [Bacillus sp. T3]